MDRESQVGWQNTFALAMNRLRWLSGAIVICLCLTPASAFAQGGQDGQGAPEQAATGGFWDVILSGGLFGVIILIVLVLLSVLAMYLIVEQVMLLRKSEVMPSGLADEVRQMLAQGRLQEASEQCRKKPSPLSFVTLSGLSEIDFGWQAMEKAMEDAVAEQAAKMYRRIEYLSVIGNLAPMCGLLGTVTGMIFAFQQVAVSQGTAGAADLAEGIYSALVTTVAGLVVAIPSLGAFAVLRNRIDQLIGETAYVSQHVFSPVRRRASQVGRSSPPQGGIPPQRPRSS
ncbi:MAG: MotA/TolQ/ExbB proton channel family protein [Planctomycetota bacterium]|nr:MotA/TolQ/ExbB proton channel family protein [Planctomycetota bacterium]